MRKVITMYIKIRNRDHLQELYKQGFGNMNIVVGRKFQVDGISDIEFLITNYLNRFAFGLKHNGVKFAVFKDEGDIFIRNNSNYTFEFPKDPPPVTTVYDLKCRDIKDVIGFISNINNK